jgi:hypothetical protein
VYSAGHDIAYFSSKLSPEYLHSIQVMYVSDAFTVLFLSQCIRTDTVEFL